MGGAFSVGSPNLERTEGEIIVRSEPVSRMSVMGPMPLILALTGTGEPGEKGILVRPLVGGLGFSSGGEAEPVEEKALEPWNGIPLERSQASLCSSESPDHLSSNRYLLTLLQEKAGR